MRCLAEAVERKEEMEKKKKKKNEKEFKGQRCFIKAKDEAGNRRLFDKLNELTGGNAEQCQQAIKAIGLNGSEKNVNAYECSVEFPFGEFMTNGVLRDFELFEQIAGGDIRQIVIGDPNWVE